MYTNLIERMHIELTNRCNAACPSCARTGPHKGNLAKHMVGSGWHDISLADIKKLCSNPVLKNLRRVHLCGNFGDPAVAPDFFKVVKYFADDGVKVSVSTNGHPHKPEDWAAIAHKNVHIAWHIDGDEDTNHIYRIGTNFNRIIENAKSFISAGGKAEWVLIPFAHNEHVIEKCETLANDLGFRKFRVKRSYRTANNGKKPNDIQLPTNTDLINPIATDRQDKEIICKGQKDDEIYLASDGDVFPCCWWGTYFWERKYSSLINEFEYLIDFDHNIHKTDIDEILLNYKEKEDIYQLVWEDRAFHVCNRQCGSNKWDNRYRD